ncbi:MAG: Fe-S cluster assembly sulfur transfer protein SufU [Candidatus Rariloculaceae bacterium]
MSDLQDLYREVILDHNRSPRNFGEIEDADRVVDGVNPLCGDHMTLFVKLDGDKVTDIRFKGTGCAISVASSSLMTERVKGAMRQDSLNLFDKVHYMLTTADYDDSDAVEMEKLAALSGVREYPTRVKCASLAWHALKSALTESGDSISTE